MILWHWPLTSSPLMTASSVASSPVIGPGCLWLIIPSLVTRSLGRPWGALWQGRHGKYAFACWCRWDVGYWTQHYKCFGLLSFICSHWGIWGAEKFRRWFWQDKAKGGYFQRFFHCRPELAVLACRPAREPKAKASSQANDRLRGQHILPRFDMKRI